jgi:predicted anti-sigma-YlaC factor YlaD
MKDELTKFVDEHLEPCQNCAKLIAKIARLEGLLDTAIARISMPVDCIELNQYEQEKDNE